MSKLYTLDGAQIGAQISQVKSTSDSATANWEGLGFYVKNNTDEPISLYVQYLNNEDFIRTSFFPGWNCDIIKEIAASKTGIIIGR